ncbi:DUF6531 domain-containing protein [bacterium]|nr:DUF6531 domain-containing protein [bacterium]
MLDLYFVELIDAANNKTRVDFARMEYKDGTGALLPTTGGEYTTSQGIVIEVADGTFDSATPVQLKTVTPDPQTVTPTPRDFTNIGYFTLNLNGATANKPIEVSFPVPQGVTVTADSQIFAAVPVEFFGKKKWMPVEPLKLEDGMLKTQSPPWPGVRAGAVTPDQAYSLIHSEDALFFLQASVTSLPAVLEWDNTDLAVYLRDVYDFIIPLPVNQNYRMTVTDPVTGRVIFQGQPAPPATEAQSIVHLQKPVSDDQSAPYIIGGSPLLITSWRVGAAKGDIRPNISFQTPDSNGDGVADIDGSITITGTAGALTQDSFVAIRNNESGLMGSDVASATGTFTASIAYNFGEPVTLLLSSTEVEPAAALRFNFSEPVRSADQVSYPQLLEFYLTTDSTKKVPFNVELLQAQQILEIKPHQSLESGKEYTIVFAGVQDIAQNAMKDKFIVRFKTKDYPLQSGAGSGRVNDSVLMRNHLIVGKDDGIEIYSTADPLDLKLVSNLSILGGIRSFARNGNTVIGVGGGVNQYGKLYQFDFSNFENPVITGSMILTRFLGDPEDDRAGETNPIPEGTPIKVLVFGQHAYIATIGLGVQIVDLTKTSVPIHSFAHKKYDELAVKDIALYGKPDDPDTPTEDESVLDVVMSGSSMHNDANNTVASFKAVDAKKILAGSPCARGTGTLEEQRCQVSAVSSGIIPGTANNVEVMQNYEVDIDQDGRTGIVEDQDGAAVDDGVVSKRDAAHTNPRSYELHDLAFIASGSFGIHVMDITDIKDPKLLGTIKVGDGVTVFDLKLDVKNLKLYVPVGADGIYIVDVQDPFLIHPDNPPQVVGKIQITNTITAGNVTIDEELNTVYVATRDKGLQSVLVGNLNVEIVTDKNNDGLYEHVGVIESEGIMTGVDVPLPEGMILPVPFPLADGTVIPAGTPLSSGITIPAKTSIPPGIPLSILEGIQPTKYYVLAQLPSAAGGATGEVKVKVSSTNFFDGPVKFAPGFPITEFETAVKYKAPVDANNDGVIDEADGSFRLYVSDPFYITAHPLLPKKEAIPEGAKVLGAGDFAKVEIDGSITQNLLKVTTDLLRQSRFVSRAIRLDLTDSEKPESKQNAAEHAGAYLHSGEWTHSAVDLSIKGRAFDYAFGRTYESQMIYDGPLGQGWDHIYFMRLLELPNGDVIWYDGAGRKEIFRVLPPPPVPGPLFYLSWFGEFAELKKLQDGNFLIHQPDGTAYLFNNYGQLSQIQDRNQNKMEFLYEPAGKLSVVLDTMGRSIAYDYNDDGKLKSLIDFAGRTVTFDYDTEGNHFLKKVTSPKVTGTPNGNNFPNGKTTEYEYQGGDNLLTKTNLTVVKNGRNQEVLKNTYNVQDRLEKHKYGTFELEFIYDEAKTTVKYPTPPSRQHRYELDGEGRVKRMITPLGFEPDNGPEITGITSFEYNFDGLLTKMTLPEGGVTEYTYDTTNLLNRRSQGNLLKQTHKPDSKIDGFGGPAEPIITEYQYENIYNQITSTKDPRGFTTTIARDERGNPTSIIHPIPGIAEGYTYNKFGQVQTATDPLGNKDTYEYFKEAESAPGASRTTDPQTGGYLKKVTIAAESTGNEGQISAGSRTSQSFEYDNRGNVIIATDGRGIKTTTTHNVLDQVMEVFEAASNSDDGQDSFSYRTQYKYDADDNLIDVLMEPKATSEQSHTVIEYNQLNQQTEVKRYAEGNELVTKFLYDERGNVSDITQPKGNNTKFLYDARDLLAQRIEAFGEGSTEADPSDPASPQQGVYQYEYDKDGNLAKEITPDIAIEHNYDGFGRQVKTIFGVGNYTESRYDPSGNVTIARVRDAQDRVVSETVNKYDDLNRLTERIEKIIKPDFAEAGQAKTVMVHDKNSRVINHYDANNDLTHFVYDGRDQLRQQIDATENAIEYSYDGNGNLVEKKEIDKVGVASEEFRWQYVYDTADRLFIETDPDAKQKFYYYDERGNLALTRDERGQYRSYSYDGLDRKKTESVVSLSAACDNDIKFDYDANSNLITYTDPCGNGTSYVHDKQNRLIRVNYPGGIAEKYIYKTGGNRLEQVVERTGTRVKPVYDANNRIKEKQITLAGGTVGTTSELFSYDALDRTTSATNPQSLVAEIRFARKTAGGNTNPSSWPKPHSFSHV